MLLILNLKIVNGNRHIFVSKSCKYIDKRITKTDLREDTNIPDKEDGFDHINDALGYMIDYLKPLVVQMPKSRPTRWTMK